MSFSAKNPPFVIIKYGPYESHGIIRHKMQRLRGLLIRLSKLHYYVELVETSHLNRLVIEMKDREIFRCDIRNLLFNIEFDDDPVCQRVIEAVKEATERLYDDGNVPKFFDVSRGMRYLLYNKGTTRDALDSDIELLFEISKTNLAMTEMVQMVAEIEAAKLHAKSKEVLSEKSKVKSLEGFVLSEVPLRSKSKLLAATIEEEEIAKEREMLKQRIKIPPYQDVDDSLAHPYF